MRAGSTIAIARTTLLCLTATASFGCPSPPLVPPPAAQPRVVSLHDVTTEIVVALGAGDRLVGIDEPVDLAPDARGAVAGLPRVGGAESILALRPTLVVGLAVTQQRAPELTAFLRGRGVEVWLGHPQRVDDVLALVTEVGARLGAAPAALALTQRLRARVNGAAPPPGEPLRVFVYDCCDPAFTAGGGALLSDLIARAGGRNVFADVAADWTKVSWEQVIARRPELIVIHDYAYASQGDVAQKRKRLAAIRSLAEVPVTVMPLYQSLGGMRSFDGLEHLRQAIRTHARDG